MTAVPLSIESIGAFYRIPNRPAGPQWTLDESYEFCRNLTTSHYENFPVGSMLLPKAKRRFVYPIYAFARISDDFADEDLYEGKRLDSLDEWGRRLLACVEGEASDPVFIALSDAIKQLDLPVQLFRDLLHAFKRDVTVKRYETLDDVNEMYCRYSANPVGRLILLLFDYRDEELHGLSDHICTALQLANFWQDVAVDLKKDRIYIPQSEIKAAGYSVDELFAHVYDDRLEGVMRSLVKRTWGLFDQGYPLVERVAWPLSAELRFTWMGGVTILQGVADNQFNVVENRPAHSKWDFLRLAARSLLPIGAVRQRWHNTFSKL